MRELFFKICAIIWWIRVVSLTKSLMRVIQKNITRNLTWNPFQLRSMAMILVLPRCLAHIESNASASSRKPTPTASEPSATPMTVHLGYGRSVGASDTASFAPASAQHTHENPAPDPSRRDARNSQLRPRERALRSSLAAMGVGCPYIHQTWHESPAIARSALFPSARLTTRLWSIQVGS